MHATTRQTTLMIGLIAVTSLAATSAWAFVEKQFTFAQDGYAEGAAVTGFFSGVDLDNNGLLVYFPGNLPPAEFEHLELTAFAMHFSGNSLSPAFDLSLDDLFGFVFEIDTDGIGDDPAFDPTLNQNLIEGIGAIGAAHFYTSGLGPNGFIGGYVGGQIGVFPGSTELADNALDSSENLVRVTQVPEPGAWLLVLSAAVGWAFDGTRRRSR